MCVKYARSAPRRATTSTASERLKCVGWGRRRSASRMTVFSPPSSGQASAGIRLQWRGAESAGWERGRGVGGGRRRGGSGMTFFTPPSRGRAAAGMRLQSVGYANAPTRNPRIGAFAYFTDCNRIPDESWPLLGGVKTVILDALRRRPHPTHFSLSEAVDVVARLGAERAYFTHIAHDLGHAETCAQLPAGVELAYDGLVLQI